MEQPASKERAVVQAPSAPSHEAHQKRGAKQQSEHDTMSVCIERSLHFIIQRVREEER